MGRSQIRQKLGVNRVQFSRMTGLSVRAISNVESGKAIRKSDLHRLDEMERLRCRLARVMKPEYIPHWLQAPNKSFDGLQPIEVLERGEIERIWTLLDHIESGIPT